MTASRKQGLKESIKKHLQDYCDNTTIHGFKYIGEKGRPIVERIWWIFVFGLSMVVSTYLINKTWQKWHDTPVIVSFSEKPTPVWQIPFPTVTICSANKVRQSLFNFTHAYFNTNLTEDEQKKKYDISIICSQNFEFNDGPRFADESTIDVMNKLSPKFEETIWMCRWKTYTVNCFDLFTPVMTEEGICFSFNMLLATEVYKDTVVQSQDSEKYNKITKSDWSLEEGYDLSAPLETEPRRALGAGLQAGVSVVLRAYEYDADYICSGPVQGFKILLHNPAEIPRLSEHYFRVSHNQELVLSVKPNMMVTSESLRSYQPRSRQCYFPSERHLAYFKVYTQHYCELECLTNYTLYLCQCVAIYMPSTNLTTLCGAGSKSCVRAAKDYLKIGEFMLSLHKVKPMGNTCNCLPTCVTLQYDAETSQAHFNWFDMYGVHTENMSEFNGVQISRVSIYFKDDQFITTVRSELYGVADFLAICGGLLGLFSGISVLSAIEIIYYITLRCYSNVRHQTQSIADDTVNHQSHTEVFKIGRFKKKDYDKITVTSYRYQP